MSEQLEFSALFSKTNPIAQLRQELRFGKLKPQASSYKLKIRFPFLLEALGLRPVIFGLFGSPEPCYCFKWVIIKTKVTASFDTPEMTTDAGVLLLREVDKITGISDKLATAIHDLRTPGYQCCSA